MQDKIVRPVCFQKEDIGNATNQNTVSFRQVCVSRRSLCVDPISGC